MEHYQVCQRTETSLVVKKIGGRKEHRIYTHGFIVPECIVQYSDVYFDSYPDVMFLRVYDNRRKDWVKLRYDTLNPQYVILKRVRNKVYYQQMGVKKTLEMVVPSRVESFFRRGCRMCVYLDGRGEGVQVFPKTGEPKIIRAACIPQGIGPVLDIDWS